MANLLVEVHSYEILVRFYSNVGGRYMWRLTGSNNSRNLGRPLRSRWWSKPVEIVKYSPIEGQAVHAYIYRIIINYRLREILNRFAFEKHLQELIQIQNENSSKKVFFHHCCFVERCPSLWSGFRAPECLSTFLVGQNSVRSRQIKCWWRQKNTIMPSDKLWERASWRERWPGLDLIP